MTGDTFFEQVAVSLDVVTARTVVGIGADREIPVGLDLPLAAFIQLQRVTGRQLLNAGKHGLRARNVAKGQILRQGALIEFRLHSGIRQNRLDLGAEKEGLAIVPIIERLDTQPVPPNKEAPSASIPNREGEHSAQVVHAVAAILLVKMDDGLSVALG